MTIGLKDAAEVFLKWVDAHLSFRYFFMFFLLSIAFLLGINPALVYLGLPPVPVLWRVLAACVSLVCGSGSIICGTEKVFTYFHESSRLRQRFRDLSEAEQEVLQTMTNGKQNSVIAWNHQPGTCTLWADKVVEQRPAALADGQFVYVLSERARKIYCKIHKH